MTIRLLKPATSPAAFTPISPATASGWLYTLPAATGSTDVAAATSTIAEACTLAFTYSTPGTIQSIPFGIFTEALDAGGTVLQRTAATTNTFWARTDPNTATADLPPLPAAATTRRIGILTSTPLAWQLQLAAVTLTPWAPITEIVAAPIVRDLHRTVIDLVTDGDPLINAGTPGKLAGSITYLFDNLAQALAVDALYQGTNTLTLSTGTALDGLRHLAVGKLQIAAEKTVPGRPSRWTLQTEIREVT